MPEDLQGLFRKARETIYVADPFEAPGWPVQRVERMEPRVLAQPNSAEHTYCEGANCPPSTSANPAYGAEGLLRRGYLVEYPVCSRL